MKKLTIVTLLALNLVATNGFAADAKTKTVTINTEKAPEAVIEIYPAKGKSLKIGGGLIRSLELVRDTNILGKNPKYIKDIVVTSEAFNKPQKLSDMKGQIDYINKMLEGGATTINIGIAAGPKSAMKTMTGQEGSLQIGVR